MNTKLTRYELTRFFISMAIVSFMLHSIWEMSQMAAYKDLAGRPLPETVALCARAIFGDVAITFWIYAIGALAADRLSWGLRPGWNVYSAVALLGATHAVWIERAATASGRWSYTDAMPVVPYFRVGVWPVLQLLILIPLTFGLSNRYALAKRSRAVSPDPNSAIP